MNEKLIRDLFEKLEQYGVKGWDILVHGMVVTSIIEIVFSILTAIIIIVISFIFKKLAEEDSDWEPGVFILYLFMVIPLIFLGSGIAGVAAPEYFVLKSFMK